MLKAVPCKVKVTQGRLATQEQPQSNKYSCWVLSNVVLPMTCTAAVAHQAAAGDWSAS